MQQKTECIKNTNKYISKVARVASCIIKLFFVNFLLHLLYCVIPSLIILSKTLLSILHLNLKGSQHGLQLYDPSSENLILINSLNKSRAQSCCFMAWLRLHRAHYFFWLCLIVAVKLFLYYILICTSQLLIHLILIIRAIYFGFGHSHYLLYIKYNKFRGSSHLAEISNILIRS